MLALLVSVVTGSASDQSRFPLVQSRSPLASDGSSRTFRSGSDQRFPLRGLPPRGFSAAGLFLSLLAASVPRNVGSCRWKPEPGSFVGSRLSRRLRSLRRAAALAVCRWLAGPRAPLRATSVIRKCASGVARRRETSRSRFDGLCTVERNAPQWRVSGGFSRCEGAAFCRCRRSGDVAGAREPRDHGSHAAIVTSETCFAVSLRSGGLGRRIVLRYFSLRDLGSSRLAVVVSIPEWAPFSRLGTALSMSAV